MIYKLNLPIPSKWLLSLANQKITDFQNTIENHLYRIERMKIIDKINPVFQLYDTHNTGAIKNLINLELQKYFENIDIHPTLISLLNLQQSYVACFPPHTDDYRNITLNYYLKQGGNNVETIFYTEEQIDNLSQGLTQDHQDLTVLNKFLLNEDCWYLLDTKRFHSVENIETERRILSLSFNITYAEFLKEYSHLLLVPPEGIEPPSPRS